MADDTEIEIIPDDAPVVDDTIVIEDAASLAEDPAAALAELREQLDREKQGRTDAERRAAEHAAAEHRAKVEAQDSNLSLVTNALATVKQNSDVLKQQYAAALAAQDFEGAAEIQESMSVNSARMLQLESGKTSLEAAPKPEEPKPFVHHDPVEAFAANLSPRSATWLRAHPEYVTDPYRNQEMLAAHNLAMARRIAVDTPEYFEAIEKTLNMEPDAARARQSAPPAAPVSRGNGGGAAPTNRGNRIRLTQAEVEMAQMMHQTPQEYALNKLALQKEGKLH